jgi:hypothetical protein
MRPSASSRTEARTVTFSTPHAPVDSSVTQAYLHLPETNAAKIRMGRNEETQREPGMHMRVFLFSFKN